MSKRKIYLYSVLICLVFFVWIFSDSNDKNDDLSERVKIALREVGNQLLLSNNDSTSLVLPVVELNKFKYKLSFQNQLSFEPSNLVSAIKNSFQKTELPNYYRVEVIQCSDNEVAYSYQMSAEKEDTIIPCAGRLLPNGCYSIEVRFTNKITVFFTKQLALIILIIIVSILDYFYSKRKQSEELDETIKNHTKLGSFQFYPEQNKLVKQATEISLSKKECELLAIFVANPNQIIKRDELTKRVWEDHGVFVGRSLDTYISKLRKKLKEDTSIKLINIHGVGYKLELN
ncbi:winged helix-turn-helix domain-containing protein [Polaribacter uvawellassae]|uniref:winged helix-turn-helix domain-containing protein n=1 Tax=Polaribacter uvawellassae TaxID=3133495 RepID=UPI00321BCEE8